jgi:hypothetical protein
MKQVVNIRDMVKHIIKVGEDTYKGTKYEELRGFYHDALSLMASRECIAWMASCGYLKRWILPKHDLNIMFKHYKVIGLPGNNAGGMSWDETSNKDHDDGVLQHVAATHYLEDGDERKFSLRSPKDVSYAYRRLYNNPPVLRNGEPIVPLGEGLPAAHRLGFLPI